MKQQYKVNGQVVNTLKEVAVILGKSRVNKSDIAKLGVELVDNSAEEVKADKVQDKAPEVKAEPVKEVKAEPVKEVKADEPAEDKAPEVKEDKAEDKVEDKAPEVKATENNDDADEVLFTDVEELKDTIKDMPTDALVDWADELGVESYKDVANKGIQRMRVAMAIKAKFFPSVKSSSSNKSVWKKFSADELVALCEQNNLQFTRVKKNENIQRMWAIKALNDAGIVPPVK